MKKLLAAILICTLLLINAAAIAESESGIAATDISTQLESKGLSDLRDVIVGTWYFCYLSYTDGYSWILDDVENAYIYYALSINEDGTGILHSYENDTEDINCLVEIVCHYSKNGSKGVESGWVILLNDVETGELLNEITLQEPGTGLMSNEYYGNHYSDYNIEFPINYDDYGNPLSIYLIKDCLPVNEIAAVDTSTTLADFDGKWKLQSANFLDRAIDYDATIVAYDGYYTSTGMVCEIDTSYDRMTIEYSGNWWNGYELTPPVEGILLVSNTDNWRGAATAYIGVDGHLYIEQHSMTMNFSKIEVDPLTEYEDTDIIFAVQTAMNTLGYDCGTPDGVSGKNTAAAISAFQTDNGLTVTGTITEETIECLRNYGFIF